MALRDHEWKGRYDRSRIRRDGTVPDPLNDFYIPALAESVLYDRESGYFTARSLSLAARGLEPFYNSGGKMRLISGTQWNPAYTKLLLADPSKLELELAEVLKVGNWDEAEKEGMLWLCRLIKDQRLEVKLALRIAGDGDGYFHNKHGVLIDAAGDKIAFEGSLNETGRGWSINSESVHVICSWWKMSHIEQENLEEIVDGYELLWQDQHPDFKVRSLPEAIQEKMIRVAEEYPVEPPSTTYQETGVDKNAVWMERTDFDFSELDRLLSAPYSEEHPYAGSTLLPISLWPHQKVAAWRLVSEYPKGFMLCDEVGLGKTIEAASAARALWVQGKLKRILICAPSSLCEQWQREMAHKFHMPFQLYHQNQHTQIWPEESRKTGQSAFAPDLVIVSHGIMRHGNRLPELEAMEPFDLVIIDEAHYLRRSNPDPLNAPATEEAPEYGKLYKAVEKYLVEQGKAKCLWLATATPIQLNFVEAWDLFRLLRRTGPFDADVELSAHWYEWVERLQNKDSLEREWPYIRDLTKELELLDPSYYVWLREHFLRDRRTRWRFIEGDWKDQILRNDRLRDEIVQMLFYLAPLTRVMIRHSRRLLEVYREKGFLGAGLAQREVVVVPPIDRSEAEKEVEQSLLKYCEGLAEQISAAASTASGRSLKNTLGFYLSFLRLRAASSLRALDTSLKNRSVKVEATLRKERQEEEDEQDEEEVTAGMGEGDSSHKVFLNNRSEADLRWEKRQIAALREKLEPLLKRGKDAKQEALLQILEQRRLSNGRIKQTVVFTRFLDTLWDVWARLEPIGLRVGAFCGAGGFIPENGERKEVGRTAVKDLFISKEIDILLCTDAAAEGLNLQVADTLINLDMPWGPMKVEQRIGRIDRIGQIHPKVFIYNLRYKDSVEDIVYDRLYQRLRRALSAVGHYSFSLLPLNEEDFRRVDMGEWTPAQLEAEAKKRLEQQMRYTELKTFGPNEIFEIHKKLQKFNPVEQETWTRQRAQQVVKGLDGFFIKDGDLWQYGAKQFSFELKEGVGALAPACPVWEQLCEARRIATNPCSSPVATTESPSVRSAQRHSQNLRRAAMSLLQIYRKQFPDEDDRKLLAKIEKRIGENRPVAIPSGEGWFTEAADPSGYWLLSYLRRTLS